MADASTAAPDTSRMPNVVRRTTGGIAYITVANVAGTLPIPNNISIGRKYTGAGTVCMASKAGRIRRSALGRSAPQIPSGTPMTTDSSTAIVINARVSIVTSQRPTRPAYVIADAATRAVRQLCDRATAM